MTEGQAAVTDGTSIPPFRLGSMVFAPVEPAVPQPRPAGSSQSVAPAAAAPLSAEPATPIVAAPGADASSEAFRLGSMAFAAVAPRGQGAAPIAAAGAATPSPVVPPVPAPVTPAPVTPTPAPVPRRSPLRKGLHASRIVVDLLVVVVFALLLFAPGIDRLRPPTATRPASSRPPSRCWRPATTSTSGCRPSRATRSRSASTGCRPPR
ncbi:hypothetical protein [Methylobrevis pamukkalensis]|uniref:hypothetical protein n=1 Tax=Methylobrevis pamukkalensis TaxID=1439726 RepID=UPI00114CAED8|nr:hypothetical protein [Methylobrevis pamukkalensis]